MGVKCQSKLPHLKSYATGRVFQYMHPSLTFFLFVLVDKVLHMGISIVFDI